DRRTTRQTPCFCTHTLCVNSACENDVTRLQLDTFVPHAGQNSAWVPQPVLSRIRAETGTPESRIRAEFGTPGVKDSCRVRRIGVEDSCRDRHSETSLFIKRSFYVRRCTAPVFLAVMSPQLLKFPFIFLCSLKVWESCVLGMPESQPTIRRPPFKP